LGTALPKLCALLAATTCGCYVFVLNGAARVQHAAGEYAPLHCCRRHILCRLPDVAEFASGHESRLAAISVAATFFDGFTYIGNSPNLLIRAIAESRYVPAPGFLGYGYIIKYALPILVPVLALVGLIFLRG